MVGVLINLIGAQTMPNLAPILKLMPDEVHLVYSDMTAAQERHLKRALTLASDTAGLEVTSHRIRDAYDLETIEGHLERFVEALGAREIWFNLTGGTKIMSLAAYRCAQRRGLPMVYVVTEARRLADGTVDPEGARRLLCIKNGEVTSEPLRVEVPIAVHLAAYGYDVDTREPPGEPFRAAATLLAERAADLSSLFKAFRVAQSQKAKSVHLSAVAPRERETIDELERLGLLRSSAERESAEPGATYAIRDVETRQFLGGFWLELFCSIVSEGSSRLEHRALGVRLRRLGENDRPRKPGAYARERADNEIDLIVSQNGRLAFVSCKSDAPDDKDFDQLDSVASGVKVGTYCGKVLVTAAERVDDAQRRRARRNNIALVCAGDFPGLAQVLVEATA